MNIQRTKKYAILNTASSFDALAGKESLDAALILASYEMDVSLFFIGDGVFQSQTQQTPEGIGAKDYISTFKALTFYDIDNIYICEKSLIARNLSTDVVFANANIVTSEQITKQLAEFDVVLTF